MGNIRTSANASIRDYVLDGVPGSGSHEPIKSEVRATFGVVEDRIDDVEAVATAAVAGVQFTTNAIRVRSTGNVVIATALENGDTINGVVLATGNHVFLGSQTAPAENGIYTVPASGAASRATFADSAAELARIGFLVQGGTVGAGERYMLPLAAADITLGTTALNFAQIGIEVSVAAEVVAARGSEASLSARLAEIEALPALAKAEWASVFGSLYDSASVIGGEVINLSEIARTYNFSGYGDVVAPPVVTTQGIYLPGFTLGSGGSSGGITTARKPVRVDVTVRTGASGTVDDADVSEANLIAVGSIELDPDGSPWSGLFIPYRDPATTDFATGTLGAFIDIVPGDWGAEVGVAFQGWDADGNPASLNEPLGERSDRVSPNRSYYLTDGDARTSAWSALSGAPGIAIQFASFTNLRDGYAPSDDLRAALADTSSVSLPAGHQYGEWRLRMARQRLFLLKAGVSTQLDLAFIGDSWTDADFRYTEELCDRLVADYGDAGPGWIGFGFPAFDTNAIHGNARSEVYVTTKSGTWTSDFANGSAYGPDVSNAKSSTALDKYTVIAYAAATAILSELRLFWEGTADGVTRYRIGDYDGSGSRADPANYTFGAWTTRNVQGSGHQSATLSGLPSTAGWCFEIEVVSGSVRLNGLNGKSAAPGVRVHKLGCTGSMASDWIESDAAKWQAAMTTLAPHVVFAMFGTNEKALGEPPTTFGGSIGTILSRVRTALPAADLGVGMPCENTGPGAYTMAQYALQAFQSAENADAAWLNLQPLFGLTPDEYAFGEARSWMLVDEAHPAPASYRSFDPSAELVGIIPDAFHRILVS